VRHAHAWASIDYAGDGITAATYLKLPKDCKTTKIMMETKGWARKKQTAKVMISHDIKKALQTYLTRDRVYRLHKRLNN
jgi:hypothetical protein